jgi:hypothetical protein
MDHGMSWLGDLLARDRGAGSSVESFTSDEGASRQRHPTEKEKRS